MRQALLAFAVLLTVACGFAPAAASPSVRVTPRDNAAAPHAYERATWRIDLDGFRFDNPYDPEELAVDATFTGPGDRTLTVPGFWMTPPGGNAADAGFHVRFAPPAPGRWTLTVTARDKAGSTATSAPVTFDVAPGTSRGFVRRARDNPRYFRFDSGEPFFMVGLNLAWATHGDVSTYEPWFRDLAAAGGNFARIWMSHPNVMTETAAAGVGRFDQDACAFYDTVMGHAERHGVYCMVTFNNYRDLRVEDEWGKCQWPNLPHNAANGGPATRPVDFIADPRSRRLYRNRLRYVAARWGAFSSVAFWEFWNEQAYTNVPIPPAWTAEMAKYLKSVDAAHGHLVTTSFGNAPQPEVWAMPEIDLVQEHLYPNDDASGPVSVSAWSHRALYPDKPHLVGEFGISARGTDATFDPKGVGTNLHNGLWAGIMSGSAGGAAVWWWDSYVAPRELWHAFRGPANFSRSIDWPARRFEPVYPPAPVRLDAGGEPETFADTTLPATGDWGRSHGRPVDVLPNGLAYRTIPRYVYGFKQARLHTPTTINVEVPAGGGAVVVRVGTVSDAGILRISVDGEPKADFPFSALPTSPGHASTEARKPEPDDPTPEVVYQGVFNKDCEVPLAAGRHALEIANLGNDWIGLESVTLRRVKSSRYAELQVIAMRDAGSGEFVAWLRDPLSNYRSDAEGLEPRTIPPSRLSLPLAPGAPDGDYELQWWDTRSGKIENTARAPSTGGVLHVQIPPVRRDVALRAVPAAPTAATR